MVNCNANIDFNHECLRHQIMAKYAKITIPKTSSASNYTRKITMQASVAAAIKIGL
jgi:hypothetical protein